MKHDLIDDLKIIFASTYGLYLKTQNYHWHVTGPHFKSIHELLEGHYLELAEAVDLLAEQIRIMGHVAPASFKEFEQLSVLKSGNSLSSAMDMVKELAKDHDKLVHMLNTTLIASNQGGDEGLSNVLSDRINAHEKARWMLQTTGQV